MRRAGLPKAERGADAGPVAPQAPRLTARAAMAYLHGSNERQQAIADEVSRQAAEQLGRSKTKRSGTQRARRRLTAS